jgi:predicted DNA-binding ribbon-helix-helix protein
LAGSWYGRRLRPRTTLEIGAGSFSFLREDIMKSPVVKRSIVVGRHKTSISIEDAFWSGMKDISGERGNTLSELVTEIDGNRQQGNLSSAIRLFVLDHYKSRVGRAPGQSKHEEERAPILQPVA